MRRTTTALMAIIGLMATLPILLAMAPPPEGGGDQNPLISMLPFVLIIFIFYFLAIRPQQKKAKQHKAMLEELKKGDKILTSGGIYGKIEKISADDDVVQVSIADKCVVKMSRSAIADAPEKNPPSTAGKSAKAAKKEAKQAEKEKADRQKKEENRDDSTSEGDKDSE